MPQLELVHPAPLELGAFDRRGDHGAIARMVNKGARVLDVGCGDGALLRLLARERGARARGLESDPALVHACVSRGLWVVQGDAERDLEHFPSGAFDYVVFSHTLFGLRRPLAALKTAARLGERVIVAFDNAGHWQNRLRLLSEGRLARWGEPPAASVRDFAEAARGMRLTIERAVPLARGHLGAPFAKTIWRANWLADQVVFLLAP